MGDGIGVAPGEAVEQQHFQKLIVLKGGPMAVEALPYPFPVRVVYAHASTLCPSDL
jgi:hypothetical protein